MKSFIYICFFLLSFNLIGQVKVGIGTKDPSSALDVNGRVKIREIPSVDNTADFKILTANTDSELNNIPKDEYTQNITKVTTADFNTNETIQVVNPTAGDTFNIIITSKNPCDRGLIAIFKSEKGAFSFINGVARDVVAVPTVSAISAGAAAYSVEWTLKFPGVTRCRTLGGEYFDFSIKKINNSTYEVTNLSERSEKSLTFYFEKI